MINPKDFANFSGFFPFSEEEKEGRSQEILSHLNVIPWSPEMDTTFIMRLPNGDNLFRINPPKPVVAT